MLRSVRFFFIDNVFLGISERKEQSLKKLLQNVKKSTFAQNILCQKKKKKKEEKKNIILIKNLNFIKKIVYF